MTNTKRALLASVLSLLVCVSMLIGSTFAWFTDTASISVNKIQAGTLKVDLVDADGNSLVGQPLDFIKAPGAENEAILWEPGCTYHLPDVYVKNKGNLALTFVVNITGIAGDAELNKAIEWTIELPDGGLLPAGETSGAIKISGHMKEDAGNEYKGLSIDGIAITVNATQASYESDSNGKDYDLSAAEDEFAQPVEPYVIDKENKVITINTAAAFLELANGAEAFGLGINDYPDAYTVKLANDVSLNGAAITPIECWWSNFDGAGYTVSNAKVTEGTDKHGQIVAGMFMAGSSETTLNVTNVTFEKITVTCSTADSSNAGVVAGYSANATITDVTVDDCSVSGAERMGGIVGMYNGTISGCTVSNTTLTGGDKVGGIVGDLTADGGNATISDCHVDTLTIDSTGGKVGSIAGRIRQDGAIATLTASTCTAKNVIPGTLNMCGVQLNGAVIN